jgi:hypothetical protein
MVAEVMEMKGNREMTTTKPTYRKFLYEVTGFVWAKDEYDANVLVETAILEVIGLPDKIQGYIEVIGKRIEQSITDTDRNSE